MAEGGEQLSGITVVYLIAVGFQVFVLLFLFAKRQIMRFAWASRREPHTEIGKGAPKWFKNLVAHNIARVQHVKGEPTFAKDSKSESHSPHGCRLNAMVEVQELDKDLDHVHCKMRRSSREDFYSFLKRLKQGAIPELPDRAVERISILYEWARFSSKPFADAELQELRQLLDQLKALIRRHRQEIAALSGNETEDSDVGKNKSATQPLLSDTVVRKKAKKRRVLRGIFRNKPVEESIV